jgi:histidine ammonia-lyase
MGANSAIKTLKIIENVEKVLAIELLTASQAMFFSPNKLSKHTNDLLYDYRQVVKPIKKDTILSDLIAKSTDFVSRINFVK